MTPAASSFNDTWIYDGSEWSKGPLAPPGLTPREGVGFAYDSGRQVLVAYGGWYQSAATNETWELVGQTRRVAATP